MSFGTAPYFALVTLRTSDGALEKLEMLANPYATLGKGRGLRVAEWLAAHKAEVVLTQEDLKNKRPGYALANGGLEVPLVKAKTLTEALEAGQVIRNTFRSVPL